MAAAVPNILINAGRALLAALGVGVGGKLASDGIEEARRRAQEAEAARSTPIARSEPVAHTSAQCACPPEHGVFFVRQTAGWSADSISYQARICGHPVVPGGITEWAFGPTFDGFDRPQCLLKEAKARYDQFFDAFGQKHLWWEGHEPMYFQARTQDAAVRSAPPARLHWYFMESKSAAFFSEMFTSRGLSIVTLWQP